MEINCKMSFSESGKIVRIVAENGRIILEALVHGSLERCALNADNDIPISRGTANIFRGELYALAGYEILDIANERIIEK